MTEAARAQLTALLERVVPARDGLYRLLGPITPSELRALHALLGAEPPALEIVSAPFAPLALNDVLLTRPPVTQGCVCIDFGTAASKAAYEPGRDLFVPLAIGEESGDPFWVRSAVAIDAGGAMVFGRRAIEAGVAGGTVLTSFKSRLWGDPAILDREALGGGGITFSHGEAIQAYLAFLTHRVARSLTEQGADPHVPRRFAMPFAYDEAKRGVRTLLGAMIGRAVVLADTLGDKLPDGVPAARMRVALDAVAAVEAPPWLFAAPACVGEPVAAGAFALHDETTSLTVYMIADVGAGTTDFSILCLKKRADGDIEPIQIAGGALSVELAGDAVDAALAEFLVEQVGEEYRPRLCAEAAGYKERLFSPEAAEDELLYEPLSGMTMVEVSRRDFLASRHWTGLVERLRAAQARCFDGADREYLQNYGTGGVRVVITGGGAGLPLTQALASGLSPGEVQLRRVPVAAMPLGVRDRFASLRSALPRLAVALGGARDLPADHDRTDARPLHGHVGSHRFVPINKVDAGLIA